MTRDPRAQWPDAAPEDDLMADLLRVPSGEPPRNACPSPELVQASEMGTLPPGPRERIVEHVRTCLACQMLAEALADPSVGPLTTDERTRALTRLRMALGSSSGSGRRLRRRLTIAAASLVIALAGWTAMSSVRSDRPREADRSSVFRLDKPALQAAGGALVWRGSDSNATGADLERALRAFDAGDFPEADRRLGEVVTREPENAPALFYLGVTRLFLGSDPRAIEALEHAERLARDDERLASETAWYLALAYRRTGQSERADLELEALCSRGGARAERACLGLRELRAAPPRQTR